MSTNDRVATILEEIAQMMEVLGEDGFRVNAHNRAARAVSALTDDIAVLAKDRKKLLEVEGIGPKTADKIIEFCTTGTVAEHAELKKKVPAGVLQILELQGLGPKTVQAMWQTLGVDSIAKLKQTIDDGSLKTLPRMGDKAIEKIKSAIEMASQGQERLRLGQAWSVAERIVAHLKTCKHVAMIQPAGSLRRGRETVADIDIVVAMKAGKDLHGEEVMELARNTPGVMQVLVSGATKTSVRVSLEENGARWGSDGDAAVKTDAEAAPPRGKSIQADVRVVPLRSFGAALQYFTGSKDHNVHVRSIAQQHGLTLNEWGLYREKDWEAFRAKKYKDDAAMMAAMEKVEAVAGETEETVYKALNLVCPAPEMREDRGEVDLKSPLTVVELSDIKAELHAHTTASDGVLSIEQLARAAHARGFHTIAVTDHSQSSSIAGGLKPDRLREHVKAVHEAHAKLHKELGIRVLAGSEVDILADGSLDYKDEILQLLDVVVASPHAALTQDSATATKRLLKAIEHPLVHIIGHPTGRLINRRKGLEPAMNEIIAAAKQHNVALEINAHWMRLDLRDIHVRAAVEAGMLIAIDCDVHHPDDFDNLRFGVMTGRRGWLTKELCINTWSAAKLEKWLKGKR
ncbi:MAG: helix-hairpin-helix domain-containing protein [Phycisphaerales bacterium]